jgi:hypothetical protein
MTLGCATRGLTPLLASVTVSRAVLTHNRKHFRNLHNAGQPHSGMVLCTEDTDFDSLATRVDQALSQVIHLTGEVIRVTRARH